MLNDIAQRIWEKDCLAPNPLPGDAQIPESNLRRALQLGLGRPIRGLDGQAAEKRGQISCVIVHILFPGELSCPPRFEKASFDRGLILEPHLPHQELRVFRFWATGDRTRQSEAA